MKILIMGGTGFVGPRVVKLLVEAGHEVAVFHRGRTVADLPVGAEHILGDRGRLGDYADEFGRFSPEVVVDVAPMLEEHARTVMETFGGLASRVVAVRAAGTSTEPTGGSRDWNPARRTPCP